MTKIKEYFSPTSLAEASEFLVKKGTRAAIVAGSTSVVLRRPGAGEYLVDLRNLGLAGIEKTEESIRIGSMTTLSALVDDPTIRGLYDGVLSDAAGRIGATPLRNRITLGGNAIQVLPWSDLPGVLMALKARFHFDGPQSRTLEATQLYERHPSKMLLPGEILTSVEIPLPKQTVTAAYHKEVKTRFDYAAMTVTVAAWLGRGGQVEDARIVFGSVRPTPTRSREAESSLISKIPNMDDIVRAAARASGAVEPAQDYRYSKEYRSRLVKVWTKRCLVKALLKEEGGDA